MTSLVLTDSSQLTAESFEKLPDQITYNGFLPPGDRGRRRSKFVLYSRPKANGVKPSKRYVVEQPHSSQAILDSKQHSISYTLTRNQAIIVEYQKDEDTDMFQDDVYEGVVRGACHVPVPVSRGVGNRFVKCGGARPTSPPSFPLCRGRYSFPVGWLLCATAWGEVARPNSSRHQINANTLYRGRSLVHTGERNGEPRAYPRSTQSRYFDEPSERVYESLFHPQIGRSSDSPIDFVVMDTIPGDKTGDSKVLQSTISRFACRIIAERNNPRVARIYAAGFDNACNIFLGEKATKWQELREIDGLTTNGVLIMHPSGSFVGGEPNIGRWREVSVGGGVFKLRESRSAQQKGSVVEDETNELQDGTLIDLCGATLLWRSAEGLAKSPRGCKSVCDHPHCYEHGYQGNVSLLLLIWGIIERVSQQRCLLSHSVIVC
uniref:Pellino FHA domain-containing protein n=1 Tax=Timema douglasi TaxID=61478 RepID=A0A7R8VBF1_TIMDO|nr:unnamed protein product [Timema douglasi]